MFALLWLFFEAGFFPETGIMQLLLYDGESSHAVGGFKNKLSDVNLSIR